MRSAEEKNSQWMSEVWSALYFWARNAVQRGVWCSRATAEETRPRPGGVGSGWDWPVGASQLAGGECCRRLHTFMGSWRGELRGMLPLLELEPAADAQF